MEIATNTLTNKDLRTQFQGVEGQVPVVNSVCLNLTINKLRRSETRRIATFQNGFNEVRQLGHTRREKEMKRLTYLLLVGVVLLSLGSGNASAQATASASLQGTITDQSDAAIKGTHVTITSKEQGWTRSTATSDAGFYRFELLPPV